MKKVGSLQVGECFAVQGEVFVVVDHVHDDRGHEVYAESERTDRGGFWFYADEEV